MRVDVGTRSPETRTTDDELAEVIRELTLDDARRLWSEVIQLKPHLGD
jgi:hypothetical protein